MLHGSDILLDTMAAWDFTDIYTLSPQACGPQALGIYLTKIPCSHGITITCTMLLEQIKGYN